MELQFLQFRWSTSLVSYATNGAQPSILPIISSDHTHDVIHCMKINDLLPDKINCDCFGTEMILVEKRDVSDISINGNVSTS